MWREGGMLPVKGVLQTLFSSQASILVNKTKDTQWPSFPLQPLPLFSSMFFPQQIKHQDAETFILSHFINELFQKMWFVLKLDTTFLLISCFTQLMLLYEQQSYKMKIFFYMVRIKPGDSDLQPVVTSTGPSLHGEQLLRSRCYKVVLFL